MFLSDRSTIFLADIRGAQQTLHIVIILVFTRVHHEQIQILTFDDDDDGVASSLMVMYAEAPLRLFSPCSFSTLPSRTTAQDVFLASAA